MGEYQASVKSQYGSFTGSPGIVFKAYELAVESDTLSLVVELHISRPLKKELTHVHSPRQGIMPEVCKLSVGLNLSHSLFCKEM